MGIIYSRIKIKNAVANGEFVEIDAKVDTGATLLVLPETLCKELKLPVIRKQLIKYANEDKFERTVYGGAGLEFCGRYGWFEAVDEPMKKYALIGAVVLETLDLIIEPRSLEVYPNPVHRNCRWLNLSNPSFTNEHEVYVFVHFNCLRLCKNLYPQSF